MRKRQKQRILHLDDQYLPTQQPHEPGVQRVPHPLFGPCQAQSWNQGGWRNQEDCELPQGREGGREGGSEIGGVNRFDLSHDPDRC